MKRCFWLLVLLAGMGASGQVLVPHASASGGALRARGAEPKDPVGWLRRTDDETNIRFPGSAPFEMTVTFRAYPGVDFAKKGQSPIMTGDGTYQETWLSPHRWRREVTFGSYHAVEVEAEGVRKFQTSSDYEPSRVLMLLRALLYPMPRMFLEPELQQIHLRWKLKHQDAGNFRYVHIWLHQPVLGNGELQSDDASFDFLPRGVLVRSSDIHGLVTSWWDEVAFHSHLVPTRFAVAALGHDLVTATVKIEAAPRGETIPQMPGKRADPGMTLRPFDFFLDAPQLGVFWDRSPIHDEIPKFSPRFQISVGDQIMVSAVIDRQGIPREVEWTGVEQQSVGHGTRSQVAADFAGNARALVRALERDRFRPLLMDGKPCELVIQMYVLGRAN